MKIAAHRKLPLNLFRTLFVIASLLAPTLVRANSQVNHWGFGVTNAGPGYGSPQLSAEWQMSRSSALETLFGIDTIQSSNSLSLGVRYNRFLFLEDALNYSAYLGGGVLSATSGTSSASGFYFETGAMANMFLSGLPNLGIQLGSGLRLESPGSSRIRTVFFGGFHYYF